MPKDFDIPTNELPHECPTLTHHTFDPMSIERRQQPVKVAFGYASQEAKDSLFLEMAERIAGTFVSNGSACYSSEEL